ncbi:hypothetical protein DFH07DRAFT_804577 [Mycena maculata]|uniref:Uncharacterized protein n=1 Tax=Mycena maculata TaxID=230809 RepID=A0AAD7JUY1_9AGAR|nr:hypothetical protein DFH07DRAFT_804577 [Mycena maculata]
MPSAPSTPRASSRASPATDSGSPAKTPRKSPHCKTCGRPRKGHPRTCEYADSPLKSTTSAAPVTSPANKLVAALAAMNLEELEDRDRKEKRERRRSAAAMKPIPIRSLPSVSTVTDEILESLKAPGLLDDDSDCGGDDVEKRQVVIRWREDSGVPTRRKSAGGRMDPVSSSSNDESPNSALEEESTPKKGHSKVVGK